MKRVVVKRKKAGSGAKRNAPRRRSSAKTLRAVRTRKSVKTKAVSPRRMATKRRTVSRKPTRKASDLSALIDSPPSVRLAIGLPAGIDDVREKTAVNVERRVAAKRKETNRRPRLEIPPILLEGDEPESPAPSGPGEKFLLGPQNPAAHFTATATHLPASYSTGRLFLTARDPHWIYAHWDINTTVQFEHNARSADRHLILRMHERDLSSKPVAEIHVHPESRHWFAHVERASEHYVADLGYYRQARKWKSLATSATVRTPADTVSDDSTVEFATIPAEIPFETMLSLLQQGEEQKLPLAHAIEQLRERRLREFPSTPPATEWSAEQERALAEILATGRAKRALLGSQEITGLPVEGLPANFGLFGLPSSFEEYLSSPLGGGEPATREFWLKVNAELTIYGSTQPNAKVSIGGKEIPLQPDGSFSFRFALPDGEYEMPIVAVSADNTEARASELTFSRATKFTGEVGTQPQDPTLKPPNAEAL